MILNPKLISDMLCSGSVGLTSACAANPDNATQALAVCSKSRREGGPPSQNAPSSRVYEQGRGMSLRDFKTACQLCGRMASW